MSMETQDKLSYFYHSSLSPLHTFIHPELHLLLGKYISITIHDDRSPCNIQDPFLPLSTAFQTLICPIETCSSKKHFAVRSDVLALYIKKFRKSLPLFRRCRYPGYETPLNIVTEEDGARQSGATLLRNDHRFRSSSTVTAIRRFVLSNGIKTPARFR